MSILDTSQNDCHLLLIGERLAESFTKNVWTNIFGYC